jgi:Cd2+/Zn2+-exporting ATPase
LRKLSDHPLAAAIVKGGTEKLKREVAAGSNVQAIQGRGIKANYNGSIIHVGNKELFTEKNNELTADLRSKVEDLERQGNTTMIVEQDNKFIGIVTLMDVRKKRCKGNISAVEEGRYSQNDHAYRR